MKFTTCIKGEKVKIPVQAITPDSDGQSMGWTLGSALYDGVVISLNPGEWMDRAVFITLDKLKEMIKSIEDKVKRSQTKEEE